MNDIRTKAFDFANEAHKSQIRKYTGEPYFNHCQKVANLVINNAGSIDQIAAAFLHDTIEDCGIIYNELETEFNSVVAGSVWELTNVYTREAFPKWNRDKRKGAEKDRIAKISDFSKLIKLADRADNIRDLFQNAPSEEKLDYYKKETRELLEVLRGINVNLETEIEKYL